MTSNPCLIGRDVLAVRPVTKANFKAFMSNEDPIQPVDKDLNDELREYLRTGKINKCKSKHCDKSSEDDGDETEDEDEPVSSDSDSEAENEVISKKDKNQDKKINTKKKITDTINSDNNDIKKNFVTVNYNF